MRGRIASLCVLLLACSGCRAAPFDIVVPIGEESPIEDFSISVQALETSAAIGWTPLGTSTSYLLSISSTATPAIDPVLVAGTSYVVAIEPGVDSFVAIAAFATPAVFSNAIAISPVGRRRYDPAPSWTWERDEAGARAGSVLDSGEMTGDGRDELVVGAFDADAGGTDRGEVHVFAGSTANVLASASFVIAGDENGMQFGQSIGVGSATGGDDLADLVIGGPLFDGGGMNVNQGLVRTYTGVAGAPPAQISGTTGGNNSRLGTAVTVIEPGFDGASGEGSIGTGAPGADSFHVRRAANLGTAPLSDVSGAGDLGRQVCALDFNGDEYGDLAASAPEADASTGEVRIARGAAAGVGTVITLPLPPGIAAGQRFGAILGCPGDLDGDGLSDLVIGTDPDAGSRVLYLYRGTSGTLAADPTWSWIRPADASVDFRPVDGADLDGDGFFDLIVGDLAFVEGANPVGAVEVFYGSSAGPSITPEAVIVGTQASSLFGGAVTAVNVDGDDVLELAVGARAHDGGQTDEGRVTVHRPILAGPKVSLLPAVGGSNGTTVAGNVGEFVTTGDATCTWNAGAETRTESCGEGSVNEFFEGLSQPGNYWVRLRVVTADGRAGEAGVAVRVVVD